MQKQTRKQAPLSKPAKLNPKAGPFVLRCQRYHEFLSPSRTKVGLRTDKNEAAHFKTIQAASMAKGAAERVIMRLFDIVPLGDA